MSSPHDLSLPFRDGFRELRRTIRREARGGEISRAILGAPAPTVHVAQLADRVFSRAEHVAKEVLRGGNRPDLAAPDALLSLAGLFAEPSRVRRAARGPLYDRCHYRLLVSFRRTGDRKGAVPGHAVPEHAVSEHAIARAGSRVLAQPAFGSARSPDEIAAICAANAAALFAERPVRTDLAGAERTANAFAATAASLALACALRHPGADAATVLDSARLVAEAKLDDWLPLLAGPDAQGRLAGAFRSVLPILP